MNKVLLIDICGTLYRSNTTFDFLRYYFASDSYYSKILRFMSCKYILFLNSLLFKYFRKDFIRTFALYVLKDISYNTISKMVEDFYREYLCMKKNELVFDLIEKYRKKGYRLILVSATIEPIAKCIAKHLDIGEYLATTLEIINHNYTGRINKDLLGNKYEHLRSLGIEDFVIVTDNYSDIDLIKNAEFSYLIQYGNRKNKWVRLLSKNMNFNYININV